MVRKKERKMVTTVTSFRVPVEILEKLKKRADLNYLRLSQVIRQIIIKEVKNDR